jgi:hypothetical protein
MAAGALSCTRVPPQFLGSPRKDARKTTGKLQNAVAAHGGKTQKQEARPERGAFPQSNCIALSSFQRPHWLASLTLLMKRSTSMQFHVYRFTKESSAV